MAPEGYRWQSRPWNPSDVQRRILDGVAHGKTNAQIAGEVGMTLDGVKWHISRALAETGLSDRVSLGRWWQGGPLRMSLAPAIGEALAADSASLDFGPSMRLMALSHGSLAGGLQAARVLGITPAYQGPAHPARLD